MLHTFPKFHTKPAAMPGSSDAFLICKIGVTQALGQMHTSQNPLRGQADVFKFQDRVAQAPTSAGSGTHLKTHLVLFFFFFFLFNRRKRRARKNRTHLDMEFRHSFLFQAVERSCGESKTNSRRIQVFNVRNRAAGPVTKHPATMKY